MPFADDPDDRLGCPGTRGDGKWLPVRRVITIASGSTAMVMPYTWLPGSSIRDSPGSKKGQTCVGATGKHAENKGVERVEFRSVAGGGRRCTLQCADVKKMLACVAGLADGAGPGTEQ